MNLRPHQTRTVSAVTQAWPKHRRVLVYAPTGAGKTVIAASLIEACKGRVVVVAPWRELIGQTVSKLSEFGVPSGVVMGSRRNLEERVLVCSIETARRVEKMPDADLVVVDEAHRADTELRKALLTRYPKARHLLLSATPWREGYGGLSDIADTMITAASYSELIDAGYLVKPTLYSTPEPETGEAGTDALVAEWRRLTGGKLRTLWFASTVAQSKAFAAALVAKGVKSEHLDGSMGKRERGEIVNRLHSGETTVVCNPSCLVEGFDCPPLGAVVLRPCDSLSWYVQAVGRVMRPHPDKHEAIVLDPYGAAHRFGEAWANREWSLDKPPEVSDDKKPEPPKPPQTEREARELLTRLELSAWMGDETESILRGVASATGYGCVWLARECARVHGRAPSRLRATVERALEGDPLREGKLRAWFG